MRRQLRTTAQVIREAVRSEPQPKQLRAFLAMPYPPSTDQSSAKGVLVSLSDPTIGARGPVFVAKVRSGVTITGSEAGQAVFIQMIHGKAEIVSFG